MERPEGRRRLVVNADDFGRSASINEAVIRAHREGILTTASLMVNGDAFEQAVAMAGENPKLGVGLHLALVCGRSTLHADEIPGLVNSAQEFTNNPVAAGLGYFFKRTLHAQLEREIRAQVEKFRSTGLVMDHLNGHLHMHLHPIVFGILKRHFKEWGIQRVRLTRDSFQTSMAISGGHWAYRVSHALVFGLLSASARRALIANDIRYTDRVYGLLQDSRVDENHIAALLPRLPAGDSELYSHPSLHEFKHEFDALISPRIVTMIREHKIELIRYQDLGQ